MTAGFGSLEYCGADAINKVPRVLRNPLALAAGQLHQLEHFLAMLRQPRRGPRRRADLMPADLVIVLASCGRTSAPARGSRATPAASAPIADAPVATRAPCGENNRA